MRPGDKEGQVRKWHDLLHILIFKNKAFSGKFILKMQLKPFKIILSGDIKGSKTPAFGRKAEWFLHKHSSRNRCWYDAADGWGWAAALELTACETPGDGENSLILL